MSVKKKKKKNNKGFDGNIRLPRLDFEKFLANRDG